MRKKVVNHIFAWTIFLVSLFVFSYLSFNFLFPIRYKKTILQLSKQYSVDGSLVASVINVESRYKSAAVSSKGALGLMQIMPETAKMFSEKTIEVEDLFNPGINIEFGIKYLSYLFCKYDDEITVLACYNAGEGTVIKWMGDDNLLSKSEIEYKETYNYVNRVQKLKAIYKLRLHFL